MKVSDIMQSLHLITGEPTLSIDEVGSLMTTFRISGIPIVDEHGAPIGIVTEFDVIRALCGGRDLSTTPVAEIMTTKVLWVHPEDPVESVLKLLSHVRIIRALVVADGQVKGIVARGDVLRAALRGRQAPLTAAEPGLPFVSLIPQTPDHSLA